MICPYCKHSETKVLDSRESENSVRRRRECATCKKRFTTYEKSEMSELIVIKRDGRREPFDRNKLIRGLVIACQKRPIEREKIEKISDDIEAILRKKNKLEVPSSKVGEMVIARLKKLDKVAYIRFASVYRQFTDIKQFKEELINLVKT